MTSRFPFLLALLPVLAPLLPAQPATTADDYRAGPFEVIAATPEPVQRIREIAFVLQNVTSRFLEPPRTSLPAAVVRLAPPGMGELADSENYRLYYEPDGAAGVVLRWGPSTSFANCSDALTDVYLAQIARDRYGAGAPVPPFLARGISMQLGVAARPALRVFLQQLGRQTEIITLDELLSTEPANPNSAAYRTNAYWLTEWISTNLGRPSRVREFYASLLSGGNPKTLIQTMIPSAGTTPEALEIWWAVGYNELVHSGSGPVESRNESLTRLARFSKFDLVVNGQPLSVNLREVSRFTHSEEVDRLLELRLSTLQQSLPRIHPVFQNASRAMVVVIQSILNGDQTTQDEAMKALQSEWESATKLSLALDQVIAESLAAR